MKFLYFGCLFLWMLSACNDSKKAEVIDLQDVLPSSTRYAEGNEAVKDSIQAVYFDSLSEKAQAISDTLGCDRKQITPIDSLWLPERFPHRSVQKWRSFVNGRESKIAYFTFTDSLQMKNALFNWLDCFGSRCSSLQLYEEKKLFSNPIAVYATEKSLIYFEFSVAIDEIKMLKNLRSVSLNLAPAYVFTKKMNGKTIWWSLVDNVWSPVKKKEL